MKIVPCRSKVVNHLCSCSIKIGFQTKALPIFGNSTVLIENIYFCLPERGPRELATGDESKDPENASSAIPRQGILPKLLPLFLAMENK
jgi:hypothetical protein